MFINKVKIIALLSLISILMVGCNKKAEEKTNEKSLESITISGSTSVGPLMEKESERFEQLNPQVNVQINQLGSSAGIKDAINGTAIITSKDNKIDSLKLSQIRDIYTGKIRNWKDVIGFISFEYLDNSVNKVKIDGIEPNAENVKYNKYKLARTFLLVYKEEYLKENGNKLIDFVLSEEGQNIVEENGLIRIK